MRERVNVSGYLAKDDISKIFSTCQIPCMNAFCIASSTSLCSSKIRIARRETAVRRAGPLLGGVHAEHLHPRHGADETGRRRCHRWGHQPADAVNAAKKTGPDRKIPVWPCPVLSAPFCSWVTAWVKTRSSFSVRVGQGRFLDRIGRTW